MVKQRTKEDWSEEHIAKFWDWISQNEFWQSKYFTKQVGLGITNYISKYVKPKGKYLDYGCGSGHLLDLMTKKMTVKSWGIEYSPESLAIVNSKLQGRNSWMGCHQLSSFPSNFDSDFFN